MRWPRFWVRCGLIGLSSLVPAIPAAAQVVTVLHSFGVAAGDGRDPTGSLLLSGSTLYGMAAVGPGFTSSGTIFSIATDGTGFSTLHTFNGGLNDGELPNGSLIQSGSTLYGMTEGDGPSGNGTIFQIGTDGTGYAIIHTFMGGAADGAHPEGQLLLSGSTLYGLTLNGGSANDGTVFSIGTDGTSFSVMHAFGGPPGDGQGPSGELIQSGSSLYGMTSAGGADGLGIIFGINTDGSDFKIFHSFDGGPADGASPNGDLTLVGSTFFGMTAAGGVNNDGTIFSFTPVPDPPPLLLASGASAAVYLRRRFWRGRSKSS
jgi:uncharacterized repeat protein (TIGR03803 family)